MSSSSNRIKTHSNSNCIVFLNCHWILNCIYHQAISITNSSNIQLYAVKSSLSPPHLQNEKFIASMLPTSVVRQLAKLKFFSTIHRYKRLTIAPSLQTRGSDSHQHATIFRHFMFQLSLTCNCIPTFYIPTSSDIQLYSNFLYSN